MIRECCRLLIFAVISATVSAADVGIPLDKVRLDPTDYASLQRGATFYMNFCLGCHGLKFMRYSGLAAGIKITDETGEILSDIVEDNLMFAGGKITDAINTALPQAQAAEWFGAAPLDLSLVARSRGADWLYTYLRAFYRDDEKTWGVNNLVFPDVGMPHVLLNLQGEQQLTSTNHEGKHIAELLEQTSAGSLSPQEYDRAVRDLVNFLAYVGEPVKVQRQKLGVLMLFFVGILAVFSYLLKREYWKDIN